MNWTRLSEADREEIRRQIREYRKDEELIREGQYYRLNEYTEDRDAAAWLLVSPRRDKALLTVVLTAVHGNAPLIHVKFRGLDPEARYTVEEDGVTRSGASLMYAGYTLPMLTGDYPAFRLHIRQA